MTLNQDVGVVLIMTTEFFVAIIPPTVTHQEKKVSVIKGKPVFYEPYNLKDARLKLMSHLARFVPSKNILVEFGLL